MKKLTTALVLGATALSFGQNARTDAMAGTSTQGDMSRILTRSAVEALHYKNKVQMSANAGGEYNFIATKTLSDNFIIGASLNSSMNHSGFYSSAYTYHNALAGNFGSTSNLSGSQNDMPNILVGFELSDMLAFGGELFLDANRYKAEQEAEGSSSETKESISTKGFILSAEIGEDFLISPRFGMGFPKNKFEYETTLAGTTTKYLAETEKALQIKAGADVVWSTGIVDMEAGFGWEMEKFQFKNTNAGVSTTEDITYKTNAFDLLYGVTGTLSDDLLWVVEYRGEYVLNRSNNKPKDADPAFESNTDVTHIDHEVAIGFERPVKGFWIFDGLTPRAGFVYSAGKNKNATTIETGDKNDSKSSGNYADGATLSTGFGLTKGRATIDIAADFSQWDASFTGPNTASATLTVDFGKNSKSSSKPAPFAEDEY